MQRFDIKVIKLWEVVAAKNALIFGTATDAVVSLSGSLTPVAVVDMVRQCPPCSEGGTMDFTDICTSKLLTRVGEANVRKRRSEWRFSLEQIKQLPRIIHDELDVIDDIWVVTYYMANNEKTMGAYWVDRSIRVVEYVQPKESFILKETGRERIEDVPESTVELLSNTYFEVIKGDKKAFTESIEHWIAFMRKQESLLIAEERARGIYDSITNDGVFYTLY